MTKPPEHCDILITNATLLTMDPAHPVIRNGALAITVDRIVAVGTRLSLSGWQAARSIDAKGGIVYPGFVDGHYHFGLHLIRGLLPAAPDPNPIGPFPRFLNALSDDDEAVSAQMAAAEAVLNGYTGVVEAGTAFAGAFAGNRGWAQQLVAAPWSPLPATGGTSTGLGTDVAKVWAFGDLLPFAYLGARSAGGGRYRRVMCCKWPR